MNQLNNISSEFDNQVNGLLSGINSNKYLSTALSVFLILYASLAAPKLPESIARLFDNTLFKGLICFLIAYMGNKNPTVAIISAVGLIVSLQTLQRYEINKQMVDAVKAKAPGFISEVIGAVDDELGGIGDTIKDFGRGTLNDMIGANGSPIRSDVDSPVSKYDDSLQGVANVEELEENAPVDGTHQGTFNAHSEIDDIEKFRGSLDDRSLNYASYY